MSSSRNKEIALHLLIWAGLYLLWIFVFRHAAITISRTMQIEFCYLVFIAANFYFNILFAIPRWLHRQKYISFFIGSILFLLVSAWLRSQVVLFISAYLYGVSPAQIHFTQLYFNSLLNITVWTSCLIAAQITMDRIRSQRHTLLMEKEKVKNELDFLRAQNNPHFLFNTLNSVYFQIDKSNKDARESLMRLSEILRYQLYECSSEQVPVDREIIFLRNYIELQRLRLNTNFDVGVSIKESVKDFMIAPLLIMPLVENAFKYVSHFSERSNEIKVYLSFENDTFTCTVSNTIEKMQVQTTENSGIGLKNLRRRLELLYPDRHELTTESREDKFTAKLTLHI